MEADLFLHDCGLSLMGFGGFLILWCLLFPETEQAFDELLRYIHDHAQNELHK